MRKLLLPLVISIFTFNFTHAQFDSDGDGYYDDVDCNDSDPSVNPGAYEDHCNNDGIDNNCNGSIDENYDYVACNGGGPYDNDGDGYYDTDDCNDWDSSINPGQYEDYCNSDGIDNNCNGLIDENYDNYLCNGGAYDSDGDGYSEIDDCNDWDASVNPGIYEDQCNNDGIDNNCNGSIDENYDYNACNGIYDNDGDGYDSQTDCDDSNSGINPGAVEICDGMDNNCNSGIDEDLPLTVYYIDNDGDGYGSGSAGDFCADPGVGYSSSNDDCDDDDAGIYPGAPEIILNGIDEDCNGLDQLVGVAENGLTGIVLYPNPGSENVCIEVPQKDNDSWKVELFDSQGKRVLSESFLLAEKGIIELNTAKFEKGVYQLVLSNGNEMMRTSWVKI